MRDFGSWFAEQGKSEPVEVDEDIRFECRGCGKVEYLTLAQYESGGYGWYVDDLEAGDTRASGVCGGSQFCLP